MNIWGSSWEGGAVPSAEHSMDELLTVSYSFYCSIMFTFVFLAFFHTYSLINCLYLNKLLSLGSEILAAYVKVIFFLFLFMSVAYKCTCASLLH